jgi:hypothetical protein
MSEQLKDLFFLSLSLSLDDIKIWREKYWDSYARTFV